MGRGPAQPSLSVRMWKNCHYSRPLHCHLLLPDCGKGGWSVLVGQKKLLQRTCKKTGGEKSNCTVYSEQFSAHQIPLFRNSAKVVSLTLIVMVHEIPRTFLSGPKHPKIKPFPGLQRHTVWDQWSASDYPARATETNTRDFPGGPVARTPRSQCRRPRFNPWSGNWFPHAANATKDPTCRNKVPVSRN